MNPAEHEQWPLMLLDDGPSDESGSWGFPPAPTAASSCSMQELLVEAQIPPELHREFLHFTPAEFALVAVDLEDLSKFIDELVFPQTCLKLYWLRVFVCCGANARSLTCHALPRPSPSCP